MDNGYANWQEPIMSRFTMLDGQIFQMVFVVE